MKHIVALSTASVLLLTPMSGTCDQLEFTGQTRADVPLIKNVLRNIQLIAQAKLSCESIEAVEATVLPEGYKPPGGPHPEGAAAAEYERWAVTLCGKKEAFLVATWLTPPKPGVMFRVGFPFPESPSPNPSFNGTGFQPAR